MFILNALFPITLHSACSIKHALVFSLRQTKLLFNFRWAQGKNICKQAQGEYSCDILWYLVESDEGECRAHGWWDWALHFKNHDIKKANRQSQNACQKHVSKPAKKCKFSLETRHLNWFEPHQAASSEYGQNLSRLRCCIIDATCRRS